MGTGLHRREGFTFAAPNLLEDLDTAITAKSQEHESLGVAVMANGHDEAGGAPGTMFTERLRLEPVRPDHAHDLWIIHNDEHVAPWYDGWKPTLDEALKRATEMAYSWRYFGVHK